MSRKPKLSVVLETGKWSTASVRRVGAPPKGEVYFADLGRTLWISTIMLRVRLLVRELVKRWKDSHG